MARSYRQLCGVATALDLIGDRWALLVVRDLLLGPLRFTELAGGLPGAGTNTLADRLQHLEGAGVIRRRVAALPDGGTVYELTALGLELEPIVMALGRWGAKSMGSLPGDVRTRSRWLAAAMLAFHDERTVRRGRRSWELRLTDGPFTVTAEGRRLTVRAGHADAAAELIVTADDATLFGVLTGRLEPQQALAAGAMTLEGDPGELPRLLELFDFPVPAA